MTRKIAIGLGIICILQQCVIQHMGPAWLAARQAAAVHTVTCDDARICN